ncbi:MAG: CBS domain-containing protein [Pyrinomonadaceae bacterium]|nr:CBS domain-containing protein [Pyrinomonadaceae bacterium]
MLHGEHKISQPPVCTEEVPLHQVYEMLSQDAVRIVIVVDSNVHRVPIGVITDRSICDQLIMRRRDPRGLTAANVLDSNVVKMRRAHLLASHGPVEEQKPVLVVDRDRRLVGLYTGTEEYTHLPPLPQAADPTVPAPTVS